MRAMRSGFVVLSLTGVLGFACASGDNGASGAAETRAVGTTVQPITAAACNLNTIGLPCDPDGAGPRFECENVCVLNTNGAPACISIQQAGLANLNGRSCGSSTGVGNGACTHVCSGRACLTLNAPSGTACRPTSTSTPCDGQCNGQGQCEAIDTGACDYGRDGASCKFNTCNMTKATTCTSVNLLVDTICNVGTKCTLDFCDVSGVCHAGTQPNCDDGNPCTDDSCDPDTGLCVGVPNTAPCEDGSGCTKNDQCLNGECVPGPVNCDDGNLCTTDRCIAATQKCSNVLKCGDGDICTIDHCDKQTGECSYEPKNCGALDGPCTKGVCGPGSSCITVSTCDAGADGAAGAAGSSGVGGSAGTGGSAGSAGTGGSGGVGGSIGGTGGTAGESGTGGGAGAGGAAGEGGTAGAAGVGGAAGSAGTAGSAGEGGSGGSGGTAGQAGEGGTDAGVDGGESEGGGSAGEGGVGGSAGSAGASGTGGTGGSVATGGTGGTIASGGTGGSAGSGATSGKGGSSGTGAKDGGAGTGHGASADDDSGCGCRVPRRSPQNPTLLLLSLGAALGVLRRRKR